MARIEISGIEIGYELLGAPGTPAVASTPSGRFAKDTATLPELPGGWLLAVDVWSRGAVPTAAPPIFASTRRMNPSFMRALSSNLSCPRPWTYRDCGGTERLYALAAS
jgi:hypothetical protein